MPTHHPNRPGRPWRRSESQVSRVIGALDRGLRRWYGVQAEGTGRPYPAAALPDDRLDLAQKELCRGLMRVNHAGEVCAQALYRGQAAAARTGAQREQLQEAAREEGDHLLWCRRRLYELGADPSRLGPLWYFGSYAIGFAAGLAGDRHSLGFLMETERQVAAHLADHLQRLPEDDQRSHVVLEQMQVDEQRHGEQAREAGGRELPLPAQRMMRLCSKVMTTLAYRL